MALKCLLSGWRRDSQPISNVLLQRSISSVGNPRDLFIKAKSLLALNNIKLVLGPLQQMVAPPPCVPHPNLIDFPSEQARDSGHNLPS